MRLRLAKFAGFLPLTRAFSFVPREGMIDLRQYSRREVSVGVALIRRRRSFYLIARRSASGRALPIRTGIARKVDSR